MEELLRTRYADAEKVILVCDNLNTHTRGAFYEAFEAEKKVKIEKEAAPAILEALDAQARVGRTWLTR